MKKIISITLICSLMLMTLAMPVMALPAGELSSLSGFLETADPWLSPEAKLYAEEISTALENRQAEGGIADFMEYAGNVFLLISTVMILGGIQMIVTLSDIGEGLVSLILGVMFFVYALMMLGEAEPDPLA